jgi:hypothetical protein
MSPDDFNLLCSLKSAGLKSQGWSTDQAAHICEACSEIIEEKVEYKNSK